MQHGAHESSCATFVHVHAVWQMYKGRCTCIHGMYSGVVRTMHSSNSCCEQKNAKINVMYDCGT